MKNQPIIYKSGTIYKSYGRYSAAIHGSWIAALFDSIESAQMGIDDPNQVEEIWAGFSDDEKIGGVLITVNDFK